MKKTIVIYGSSTGICESIAEQIGEKLNAEVMNVAEFNERKANDAENLILGTSTWGAGELQDDWYDGISELKKSDLISKTVAIFGCGDSESYSDTFCNAMRELYETAKEAGARIIGEVPTDGYTYDESEAVVDGHFVGLPLDEVNEDDKTEARIDAWLERIRPEL